MGYTIFGIFALACCAAGAGVCVMDAVRNKSRIQAALAGLNIAMAMLVLVRFAGLS